ncbi:hypothetical protein H012_gp179 [Acanthamoeba polyphaga moumouvirus]|uniref:Uncharacterized protein n=2 Tax=Moumouvirus TaxID=3080801 RepID=L7RD42_9VIRU|nr:hypothetical protein H012_gp179 [Acanthamoeba polyphaga moumouvirus]AEX62386.1 hypothetical protein mv_L181 [Moumouvirus Monve]AGC02272.1 hypothetical protein Moumou_00753 [Acanthamoeba polyphaga moumouvirus]AQN68613.1 hypothetical protein [Saudi moumouvirus]
MGNYFRKYMGLIDPDNENNMEDVLCNCGKNATYRCGLEVNNDEIEQIYSSHPYLKQYFKGGTFNSYNFVSCDDCILPEYYLVFTYYPNGWKENIKFHERYEFAQL